MKKLHFRKLKKFSIKFSKKYGISKFFRRKDTPSHSFEDYVAGEGIEYESL